MSSSTDIAAVYHEFTEALTEVLAENAVGVAGSHGRTPPSRSIPTTASLDISWRSKWHSQIGKLYKTSVARGGQGDEKVTPLTRPKAGCAQDTLLCLADIARRRTTTPSAEPGASEGS